MNDHTQDISMGPFITNNSSIELAKFMISKVKKKKKRDLKTKSLLRITGL